MQRLEVSGAVRPIYGSLGVKRLSCQLSHVSHNKIASTQAINGGGSDINSFLHQFIHGILYVYHYPQTTACAVVPISLDSKMIWALNEHICASP